MLVLSNEAVLAREDEKARAAKEAERRRLSHPQHRSPARSAGLQVSFPGGLAAANAPPDRQGPARSCLLSPGTASVLCREAAAKTAWRSQSMSGKGKKSKEPARVTFPRQKQDEDEAAAEGEEQRRGWWGVNGGLEPPQQQRAVKTQRETYGCYPPSPLLGGE
uniref:Uncharacterized protein n=1 Tax=Sphaerodactylus townsendi TaxID=933632 RepID=A0ACB8E810_9SAUR